MSDAWESFDRAAFALEEAKSENEQLRARLERVEKALGKVERLTSRSITFGDPELRWYRCEVCQHEYRDREGEPHHTATCPFAALGASESSLRASDTKV